MSLRAFVKALRDMTRWRMNGAALILESNEHVLRFEGARSRPGD
jgi:hypothetical protein